MMKGQFSLGRPALFRIEGIVRRERKQSQSINLLIREEEMLAFESLHSSGTLIARRIT